MTCKDFIQLSKDLAPIISAIMPLVIIVLTGMWFNRRLEKIKSRLQIDHSIIEKRAQIYAQIQDDLNKIYSYILRVGEWKELAPDNILESKRQIDRKMYATKPYWSKETMASFQSFMKICFETYRGHGKDAGIRAEVDKYSDLENWQEGFSGYFVDGFDKANLEFVYDALVKNFSKDFGLE